MRELTEKEFREAPDIIQLIYISSLYGSPVGVSTYMEAKRKYPEYFENNIKSFGN